MIDIAMTTVGSLPAVRISAPDGACATVTLYGAHLVSWIPASGTERLFMSRQSALDGRKAIRGGIPLIFPQFAEQGAGMRHGFARVSTWRCTHHAEGRANFELTEQDLAPAHASAWPHKFVLIFGVEVEAGALKLSLDVKNTGLDAFTFASALHTYFKVADIGAVSINGVQDGELRIEGKFDQIFRDVRGQLRVDSMALELDGFRDTVVWNPGPDDAAALADLGDEEYREFVCVEPALLSPLRLEPGSSWQGVHRVLALD